MDQSMQRRCRHCRADIPTQALACPNCGRYFDGGFDFPELVDGVRTAPATLAEPVHDTELDAAPTMLPGFLEDGFPAPARDGRWGADTTRSRTRSGSRSPSMSDAHSVHLPRVGEVTDLPYAADEGSEEDTDVIDLRDRPAHADTNRSWLARLRTRT